MHKIIILGIFVLIILSFTTCAAGPNQMENAKNQAGNVAGFLQGLWHGIILLVTFVISLFNENVTIYEVHNNGGWYDFGFILGVSIIFGGGGGAGKAVYRRNR